MANFFKNVQVSPIAAFSDNYIWCIHDNKVCWVVDPGDAKAVLAYCQSQQLELVGIIVTHHHWDHTGGIAELVKNNPKLTVFGPKYGSIEHLTDKLVEGDKVVVEPFGLEFSVFEVPGHTLDHIAYYGQGLLFCGDTLFSAGCGRLFEGTPEQMHHSLHKLMQLPDETSVYCTHEYTKANVSFAQQVEPNNKQLASYANWVSQRRDAGQITLPSSIKQEKAINPFLRAQYDGIKQNAEKYVGKSLPNTDAVFAAVRSWKDNY